MKVVSVSKSRRHVWTLWVYALGFPAVAGVAPWDFVLGSVTIVSYALLGWIFLRFISRPRVEWDIDATNGQSFHLKVIYSIAPSKLVVLMDDKVVRKGQSWRLAFALTERVELPLSSQPDRGALLTFRNSLWSAMRLSLMVDGQHLAIS